MSAAITRFSPRRSILTLSLLGLLGAACAGQGDVNRVQLDAIDKSIFFNADGSPRLFYYRQTIIGVPPTTAFAFEGLMGDMSKVRFEITEFNLIGYRAYDYALGSENPTTGGDEQQRHAGADVRDPVALRRQARVQPGHRRRDQRHLGEHDRSALGPAPVHARRLVGEPVRSEQ